MSVAFGGLLGAATSRPRLFTGIGYGLAIWGIDTLGLLPALRIDRVGGGHFVPGAARSATVTTGLKF